MAGDVRRIAARYNPNVFAMNNVFTGIYCFPCIVTDKHAASTTEVGRFETEILRIGSNPKKLRFSGRNQRVLTPLLVR